ncbi:hypothetical protein B0H11DRAFT_1903478 [Mycena galericulata]|nr:hypothetical protein B0H11DRAFT_1903478 [Mycena galericulata]
MSRKASIFRVVRLARFDPHMQYGLPGIFGSQCIEGAPKHQQYISADANAFISCRDLSKYGTAPSSCLDGPHQQFGPSMDFKNFVFTFQASPTPTGARGPTLLQFGSPVDTASHESSGDQPRSDHADAQARYRARNLESERAKTRQRMRRLREKNSVSSSWTMTSSQTLRASKSFAAFRERVRTYPLWITTDDDKPDDLAEYHRFVAKISQSPHSLDDDEVDFLYRHVTLSARTTFAAFREFVQENIFWIRVDDNNPEDVAAYQQFIVNNAPRTALEMADDDLEFLFRHITPEPENFDGDDAPVLICVSVLLSGMHLTREPFDLWPGPSEANSECGPSGVSRTSTTDLTHHREEKQRELEYSRAQARERMAKRRAAIKNLPPEVQKELTEKARASRAKYRAQHHALLMQKEQSRRMRVFTEKHGWEEYIKRKRVRQSKSQSPSAQATQDSNGAA